MPVGAAGVLEVVKSLLRIFSALLGPALVVRGFFVG
jgi:hypothetical protein